MLLWLIANCYLLFALVMFMTSRQEKRHVHSVPAQHSPRQHRRIPRGLRQLRAGARQRLGLPADLRPRAAAERKRGGGAELPGNLLEPAASQSADEHPGTKRN